jgi:hypothetical protein
MEAGGRLSSAPMSASTVTLGQGTVKTKQPENLKAKRVRRSQLQLRAKRGVMTGWTRGPGS